MINIDDLKTGDFVVVRYENEKDEEELPDTVGIVIKEQNKILYKYGRDDLDTIMEYNKEDGVYIAEVYRDNFGYFDFYSYTEGQLIYSYDNDINKIIEKIYNKEILTEFEMSILMNSNNIKIIKTISNEWSDNLLHIATIFKIIDDDLWMIKSLKAINKDFITSKDITYISQSFKVEAPKNVTYISQPFRVEERISIGCDTAIIGYVPLNKKELTLYL